MCAIASFGVASSGGGLVRRRRLLSVLPASRRNVEIHPGHALIRYVRFAPITGIGTHGYRRGARLGR
ncbi:MAG: hypothetical protein ACKV2U_08370, partial [Bryobacteraceae bacterium]